jgi:hypothetical protein
MAAWLAPSQDGPVVVARRRSMDATLERTRGFERNDPGWHCRLEIVETVDEVLTLLRDYIATLSPRTLMRLPDRCRAMRVKAEDDVEYWTFRLSHRGDPKDVAVDEELREDAFYRFLHASLRIAQIHKAEAESRARAA